MSYFNFLKQEADKISKASVMFGKRSMPLQLVLFVTSHCNMRCEHCFYIEEIEDNTRPQLSLPQIKELAKNIGGLSWVALTGGEPYLRKDLTQIVQAFYKHCHPNIISHVTNGYFIDRTPEMTNDMASSCPDSKIMASFSLDGLEKTHDKIRKSEGSFQRALETFRLTKTANKHNSNFYASIVITAQDANKDELIPLIQILEKEVGPDGIYLNLYRDHTKPSNVIINPSTLKSYKEAVSYIENLKEKNRLKSQGILDWLLIKKDKFQKRIITQTAEKNAWQISCLAGKVSTVIDETGNVYACELLKKPLGNILKNNFRDIWFDKEAIELSDTITKTNCYCTHECSLSSSIIYSPKNLIKSILTE
jgi:MoaA/NifB/PqqE/SkfB family radical SAM enzyme